MQNSGCLCHVDSRAIVETVSYILFYCCKCPYEDANNTFCIEDLFIRISACRLIVPVCSHLAPPSPLQSQKVELTEMVLLITTKWKLNQRAMCPVVAHI